MAPGTGPAVAAVAVGEGAVRHVAGAVVVEEFLDQVPFQLSRLHLETAPRTVPPEW